MHNAGLLRQRTVFTDRDCRITSSQQLQIICRGTFCFWAHGEILYQADVAIARVLGDIRRTVVIGYRLPFDASDFVAPLAGPDRAGNLVAGNTHFNFYYDHIRMYSMVVFTSGCILWLYLRMSINRLKRIAIKYIFLAWLLPQPWALLSLQALQCHSCYWRP